MNLRPLFLGLLSLLAISLSAQNTGLRGTLTDAEDNTPLTNATIILSGTGVVVASDSEGRFELDGLAPGSYELLISHNGHQPIEREVNIRAGVMLDLNGISMTRNLSTETRTSDIPTVTLAEAEAETDGAGEVANLLHASRDVFQNISAFGWFYFRFRERGYDSEHFPLLLNGVRINDPETGIAFYGEIGGLNDVLRRRQSAIGMEVTDFTFSEIGGATFIDTRASAQRKQVRASYAVSNRTYTNRVMVTASTGLMPGGWAVSASASRRWAQEGYQDGTFYDGYSYFLSVEKQFARRHGLNFTLMGAPTRRGRAGDTFQEMYDLAGTIRYNPFWGYWNGEKRNSNVARSNQPIAILRYDWSPADNTSLIFSTYGQAGKNGYTRLDWFQGNNPNPDYNRRLPSAFEDPELAAAWAQELQDNESLRQLNWASMYEANTINTETIQDANGIPGNSVTGKRSQYVISDNRSDSKELGSNLILRHSIDEHFTMNAGLDYQYYLGNNFKVVDDILGGDFIVDWDRFAQQDQPDNPNARDNDLRITNHIVKEGETYGYNYDENIRKFGGWLQFQYDINKLSLFAGGELNNTTFWRTGNMQNGRFPNESLGDSDKQLFSTYGLKGGATFKLNGRNYIYVHGFYGTRAPQFRDVYLSPRIRNEYVEGADVYTIKSLEGGYQLRAPKIRARATGYITQFENEIDGYMLFQPSVGVFGTQLTTGINRQHAGVELAVEAKPFVGWTVSAATNLGQYIYTNRPKLYLTLDNTAELILDGVTVYQKHYNVPRTPQTAASLGLKYESRRFWFASLTLNWADNLWYNFDRTRRTAGFVETFVPESDAWNLALDQQKAPAAYTLDFFGGKSWRFGRKYFLYLNAGLNNILNNQNVIISGRDAYRNGYANDPTDVRLYTSELIYAPGFNYFVSLSVRI
ncbi:MAG: TonB-dependent receptor [Saprospiraceae bacterium]